MTGSELWLRNVVEESAFVLIWDNIYTFAWRAEGEPKKDINQSE
jgi:hypothetical protein